MPEDARILIVEDEGIEALDLQRRLIHLGYPSPDIAMSGEEAVTMAAALHPDLILMDIRLGGEIDGVTAAERIRADADVPIIYVTAYADETTLRRAKITEPHGYIVKPFREREVRIAIEMTLYRHGSERRLRTSEKFFSTTLRSVGDAVVATDAAGHITFMNVVAERLTGWSPDEAQGRKLTEIVRLEAESTRQPVDPRAECLFHGGTSVVLGEYALVDRSGNDVPVQITVAPVRDERGILTGVILVIRDVTEAKRFADELRESNAELERAGRVREKLLLNMTHELRTPLNAIMGFTGTLLLKLPGPLNPEQEAQLRQVAASAEHLLTLIADLLDLAALESGRLGVTLGDVSCRDILTEVAALVEPRAAEHGVKVEVVLPEVDACVRADRGIVSRILLLLTREAVQSAEAGLVRLGAEPDGDGVNLSITGAGLVASRDGAALADWFGEVGADQPLPDLGRRRSLYLGQRLAALMDARIELVRAPGEAGALRLRLPAADP